MRQIFQDRIDRIDAEIRQYQDLFRLRYSQEQEAEAQGKRAFFTASHSSKSIQEKIQQLLDKREEVLNKAIFGTMKRSKFRRMLEDRQFNYDNAIEDRDVIQEELFDAAVAQDEVEIKRIKTKLGHCNRKVAIYKNALEYWKAKESTVVIVPDYKPLDGKVEQELVKTTAPIDQEILDIIEGRKKKTETNTNISMLERSENDVSSNDTSAYDAMKTNLMFDDSGILDNKPKE